MEHESFENDEIASICSIAFRAGESGSRRAAGRGPHLYGLRAGDHRQRRLAHVCVFDAGACKPFFGGTYFPPDNRYGRPGFSAILERIAEAWRKDRDRVVEASADSIAQLARLFRGRGGCRRHAGYSRLRFHVPIFPAHVRFRAWRLRRRAEVSAARSCSIFCCDTTLRTRRPEALDMTLETLRAMARGRHARSAGRRFSSLLCGRTLVCSALREDAVRSGAARGVLHRGVPDHPAMRISQVSHAARWTTCSVT